MKDTFLYELLQFEHMLLGHTVSDKPRETKRDDTELATTTNRNVPSLVDTILYEKYEDLFGFCQAQLQNNAWDCTCCVER
jgi:hypothetical protein